jgi:hypothetical protein
LECPYEMQVILQRAANGRVRCYDPQKEKQVEPDEFIVVDGGKHTVAVSFDEPPRYVSAMSDGSLRLGGIFEGLQTIGDQKIILYRQPRDPEGEQPPVMTTDDLENVRGCPECRSGTLKATALVEQDFDVELHPERGAKVRDGEQRELFIVMLRCDKCGCMIWNMPVIEYFRSSR